MKTDLPRLPAPEGARRLALRQLKVSEAAAARLGSPGDRKALHDLRVGLHRLRCFLRDYRAELPPVARRQGKAFKKLAAGTNSARDTEAGISLLKTFAAGAAPEKNSLLAAARLLKAGGSRPAKGFAAGLRKELAVLGAGLRSSLAARTAVRERAARPLAAVNAKAIRGHLRRLRAGLEEIKTLSDGAEIHRARLLAKRLRYILEPEAAASRQAARFVKKLTGLHYLLGRIHDIQVLYGLLGRIAGKHWKDSGPGRAAGFLKEKEKGLFREFEKNWLSGEERGFFRQLRRYAGGVD